MGTYELILLHGVKIRGTLQLQLMQLIGELRLPCRERNQRRGFRLIGTGDSLGCGIFNCAKIWASKPKLKHLFPGKAPVNRILLVGRAIKVPLNTIRIWNWEQFNNPYKKLLRFSL